jgi:hypothetical protein
LSQLPVHTATRYVQPLREGGSLPAVVDTDGGLFVVKFRGAGQGPRALIAELIGGLIAAELGLRTPELAIVEVSDLFGRGEPDPEIQDLLRASHGSNVGLRYLDGAFNFALSAASDLVTPDWAARVVWLDALLTNPDRSHRNSNLLVWDDRVWLIDHGSALYIHHDWARADSARARAGFPLIRDHVLLAASEDVASVDRELADSLGEEVLRRILERVPGELLQDDVLNDRLETADASRERYQAYLSERLKEPRQFVEDASAARRAVLAESPRTLRARR